MIKLRVFDWAYAVAAEAVEAVAPRGSKLLEIGAGAGKLAGILERRGYRVVGVDVSPAMLRRARKRTSADLIAGASWALPLRDEVFDVAVALFTLHHWGLHEPSARRVSSALKPGGKFVVIEADKDRVPLVVDHGCTAKCLEEALAPFFKVAVKRKFPLIIAEAERL